MMVSSKLYCYIQNDVILPVLLLFQTFPFFGVKAVILDENGTEVDGEAEGYIVSYTLHCFPFNDVDTPNSGRYIYTQLINIRGL